MKYAIPFADFHLEFQHLESEIMPAVREFFSRGSYVLGENVAAFEKEFAEACCRRYAIGVGSGTEALHLSLRASGIGAGAEVITVPNTAAATALAIAASGAKPVFCDVDPATLTLDPGKLTAAIGPATRAIIPVHLYGQPCDMDPILEIARKNRLAVIEDACQSHGAKYRDKQTGSLGSLGCFSFYPTKNLGAYGDAGMIVTDEPKLHESLRLLRNLGQTDRYHHAVKGLNSRLDEMQAVLLRIKLKHLEDWNEKRRALAEIYTAELSKSAVQVPSAPPHTKPAFHLYTIRTKRRDDLMAYLATKGIQTLIHYPIPLHRQQAFADLQLPEGSFPVAEQSAREILSLPLHPFLNQDSVRFIASEIRNFYR